ncbi:unnamed protein product [Closterium sp. NIES-53]
MTVKDSLQSLASTLLRANPIQPSLQRGTLSPVLACLHALPSPCPPACPPAELPPATSLRLYEQLLAKGCAPTCALVMLANGRCDPACNVAACDFDGGDCACATGDAAGAGGTSSGSAGADV